MTTKIGVAISTLNRPQILAKALTHHQKFLPPDTIMVVVDDGSTPPASIPDWVQLTRHPKRLGIAATKNRCLHELMTAGCQHLFLFDDDAWPITNNWHQPYIQSPEPHLFAVFTTPTPKSSNILKIYEDPHLAAFHATRGYCLYFQRHIIEKVGGFDPLFVNGFEHVELSNRIHAAGHTTFAYQDVPGSDKLIYSADAKSEARSVISDKDRLANERTGRILLDEFAGRTTFIPYQPPRDVILTCLFTEAADPQRGATMKPDPQLAAILLDSLKTYDVVVLHDNCDTSDPRFQKVTTTASVNPYIQRWIAYRRWLLQHPETRFVWCVDATDVESLTPPFDGLEHGILYTGWENTTVACRWMRQNHAASMDWINTNAGRTLLNMGVVGGDRNTMLTFTSRLIQNWIDGRVHKKTTDKAGDMGYGNQAAYSMPRLETGPRVTSLFKGDDRNSHSRWKHK